jgi:hypothetical protein
LKAASLADKAKNLLKAGSSGRYFTQVGSGLTRKRKANLESPSGNILAFLLAIQKLRRQKFNNICPWFFNFLFFSNYAKIKQ